MISLEGNGTQVTWNMERGARSSLSIHMKWVLCGPVKEWKQTLFSMLESICNYHFHPLSLLKWLPLTPKLGMEESTDLGGYCTSYFNLRGARWRVTHHNYVCVMSVEPKIRITWSSTYMHQNIPDEVSAKARLEWSPAC
jgi:hypothetical protein